MSTRILCALVAVAMALAAGPAQAQDRDRSTVLFSVENPGDVSAAQPSGKLRQR